jgi:hypothetical protein
MHDLRNGPACSSQIANHTGVRSLGSPLFDLAEKHLTHGQLRDKSYSNWCREVDAWVLRNRKLEKVWRRSMGYPHVPMTSYYLGSRLPATP